MAIIMLEDASTATKYEIPMIEFEGTWTEMFKERISRGCPRGNYVVRAISNYADVLCSDDSIRDSGFSHRKFDIKSLHFSQWLQIVRRIGYVKVHIFTFTYVH